MTTENTIENEEVEISNPATLLKNNRRLKRDKDELIARVAELERQLAQAQEASAKALEIAQAGMTDWKVRWHKDTVLAGLEADLKGAASGPWKYLRDTCIELGILKMTPDESDDMERPQWFDGKGKPADLSRGLWDHLAGVAKEVPDLAQCIRSSGITGGGATGNNGSSTTTAPAPAPAAPAPTPQFGLR